MEAGRMDGCSVLRCCCWILSSTCIYYSFTIPTNQESLTQERFPCRFQICSTKRGAIYRERCRMSEEVATHTHTHIHTLTQSIQPPVPSFVLRLSSQHDVKMVLAPRLNASPRSSPQGCMIALVWLGRCQWSWDAEVAQDKRQASSPVACVM